MTEILQEVSYREIIQQNNKGYVWQAYSQHYTK